MNNSSISADSMVDTHKDADQNFKHWRKSELNIDAFQVFTILEAIGFTPSDYFEQSYERASKNRTGKGYYTVDFKSNKSKVLGLLLVDAKDAQSSLKLFAGVWIGDRVFPMVQITDIKHRKHELTKIIRLSDSLPKQVGAAINTVEVMINSLARITIPARKANSLSDKCIAIRCAHPNYPVLPEGMEYKTADSESALFTLKMILASYCDINWPRHFIKLTLAMVRAITSDCL